MNRFSHLREIDSPKATHWVALPDVSPGATIQVRHVGTCKAYQNGILRHAAVLSEDERKALAEKTSMGAFDALDAIRSIDLELYPKHIILSWKGIQDVDGHDVEFSPEVCREFLAAIPDLLFDEIRMAASVPGNFGIEDQNDIQLEALAGNSSDVSSGS